MFIDIRLILLIQINGQIRKENMHQCKAQPRQASLGYPFRNTAAHVEAPPTTGWPRHRENREFGC